MQGHVIRYSLLAVGILAALCSAVVYLAGRRWRAQSSDIAEAIVDGARGQPSHALAVSFDELVGVPEPVLRYFRFALPEGRELVRIATVMHEGEFASKPGKWSPFTSSQLFRTRSPAFLWDAHISMLPGFSVRVRDSYADGVGSMKAAVAGLISVADVHGTPDIASGALARVLAEFVWIPTALLPYSGLIWTAIDDSSARAELTDGATSVTVIFHFAPDGPITGISGTRMRDVQGHGVPTAWQGSFRDYQRVNGVMVPMAGEVAWVLPDGPAPYWRGRIKRLVYN